MSADGHEIRRVLADKAGTHVAAVVEQTVYTYGDENAPVLVAEVEAHLEDQLRDSGRLWAEPAAGVDSPEPGDSWASAEASAAPST